MAKNFKVEGMTCGGCARAVARAIAGLDPTAKVNVDLDHTTVTVETELEEVRVADAIRGAGYTVA